MLNVPWLALGTVYLLAGERVGDRCRSWLLFLSGLATGIVLFAPTRAAVTGGEMPTGKDVFGVAPRCSPLCSPASPLVIIGGALEHVAPRAPPSPGAARVARTAGSPRRLVLGNVLIAVGTLILSASGTLAGRLGKDQAFAVTLLAGIVVLFAGFLVASAAPRAAGGAARRGGHTRATRRYTGATRISFPLTFFGSESTNRIFDGHLYRARWSWHQSINVSSSTLIPSRGTT